MSTPINYNPARVGCTCCGTQKTATVDGIHGRRCAACPPGFDRAHVTRLLEHGWSATALAYLHLELP